MGKSLKRNKIGMFYVQVNNAKKKQNRNVLCIGKPCKKRNKIGMFYVWVKHKKKNRNVFR